MTRQTTLTRQTTRYVCGSESHPSSKGSKKVETLIEFQSFSFAQSIRIFPHPATFGDDIIFTEMIDFMLSRQLHYDGATHFRLIDEFQSILET